MKIEENNLAQLWTQKRIEDGDDRATNIILMKNQQKLNWLKRMMLAKICLV
jgi:hypothetical protein